MRAITNNRTGNNSRRAASAEAIKPAFQVPGNVATVDYLFGVTGAKRVSEPMPERLAEVLRIVLQLTGSCR